MLGIIKTGIDRANLRLVIDYKPLNHFLQDDKFPIPKASSLPILIKESNIFSKFDLKSGFWQLGIDPSDRHKTAFCIPNAQYQWTVLPFRLKMAPSLFQKAMTRIFEPLLEHAIIYIDDILLFSKDIKTHKVLLNQFFDIANHHGLMFSEKKIHLAQPQIDFLGMHFFQGSYQPQPHIAKELLKFPDKSLTVKQIQQFLGIVNYTRDFIPNVATYTSPLSKLLKKAPPSWGLDQTRAIQELKRIAQSPPALKIPGEGKRILQTDASDFYWGAVLIEEQGNKKYYCGHASGQFKEAERHYHTTFKEALVVKNGIKKFDFHLRKYHFEVQMDNSSFPKILEFKNKMPPDPQIKGLGKQNLIPDFLSRPEKAIQMITSTHSFPIIFMKAKTLQKPSSEKTNTRQKPLSNKAKTCRFFPPGLTPTSHPDILEYAKSHYFYFIHETMKYKVTAPFMFNPNNPYGGEATLWAIWCKTVEYSIPIALRTKAAYDILMNPDKEDYLFWTLLEWFFPLNWWREELRRIINFEENKRIPGVNYPPLTSISTPLLSADLSHPAAKHRRQDCSNPPPNTTFQKKLNGLNTCPIQRTFNFVFL
ncbi:hypothetical protein CR513_32308, partial [Mucuna pruriens]